MKREQLAPLLRKEYTKTLPCGVEKLDTPGFENLWFVVPPAPPLKMPPSLSAKSIARANFVLEQLPTPKQASELDYLTSYLFLRREAIQSSRMEGTWSTIDQVLTPGSVYDTKEGKSERAAVLGYANALEQEFQSALKKGVQIFTHDLVMRLHAEITRKDPSYRGTPGRIRTTPVFIGGLHRKEESIYNPTPPKQVARCLKETLTWMSDLELSELGDAGMGMPLPVRMAIAHSHFEAVHPFSDGNGRVGRMLMTLQMVSHQKLPLYLSGYIEAEKQEYVKALEEAQKKLRYGPIVEFICEALAASYYESDETKAAIQTLPEQWRKRGAFREHSASERFLSLLTVNPIFSVKEIEKKLQITRPAANRAVDQLVKASIVRERTGNERYRVFAAEEVIELLARPFGESPIIALSRANELLALF